MDVWIPAAAGLLLFVGSTAIAQQTPPGDWPQWGGSPARNNVSPARGLPVEWDVGQSDSTTGRWLNQGAKNVRWAAQLGKDGFGSPVVADGKVFCTSNNEAGYLPRFPVETDLGCLLCFDRATGRFLWQHTVPKLRSRDFDYGKIGMCSCPLVEGKRLWIVTNRSEVVCLDTDGSPTQEPRVVWSFDMIGRLGTTPRYMSNCSVTSGGELLFVCTSHGRDVTTQRLTAPEAPSFIALDKQTGKLVWADNSPGANILDGQWSSPAYGVLGGVPQVIFGGGDGWLYSFLAAREGSGFGVQGSGVGVQGSGGGVQGSGFRAQDSEPGRVGPEGSPAVPRPTLLWKFDCNPKDSVWEDNGGSRNFIVSTPVICDGRVYIATGRDPESSGDGQGDLWCIDPTRRGDTSAELVVDRDGKPVAPAAPGTKPMRCAVDKEAGQKALANPNSAAVWHHRGRGPHPEPDETADQTAFRGVMHRSIAMPVISDGLLVIGDLAGLVHCLDAKTGQSLWTHDCMSGIWGSPLVAEGRVYIATQEGDVLVFALARDKKLLAKNRMGTAVHGTPVAAGNTLYIATATYLFAIGSDK